MYMLSVVAALTAAAVLRRTIFRGPRPTLMLELPPYRMPVVTRAAARHVAARALVSRRGRHADPRAHDRALGAADLPARSAPSPRAWRQSARAWPTPPRPTRGPRRSPTSTRGRGASACGTAWPGGIGHLMEPVIAPLGFDWRIGVGILGAFAAREVFVSTHGHRVRHRERGRAERAAARCAQGATAPGRHAG